MVTCRALPAGTKNNCRQEPCSLTHSPSLPPRGSRAPHLIPSSSPAATGWTSSSHHLREEPEGEGEGETSPKKQKKGDQGPFGSGPVELWRLSQVSTDHIHTVDLSTVSHPQYLPQPGGKSFNIFCPQTTVFARASWWNSPCSWPLVPQVSAIVAGKELDQHPIPTPPCHPSLACVFPHSQSPLLIEITAHLSILTSLFLEAPR